MTSPPTGAIMERGASEKEAGSSTKPLKRRHPKPHAQRQRLSSGSCASRSAESFMKKRPAEEVRQPRTASISPIAHSGNAGRPSLAVESPMLTGCSERGSSSNCWRPAKKSRSSEKGGV